MNFLIILKLVVQLLPMVLEAVKIAEHAIPVSGQGAAKLQFVKDILTTTVDLGTDVSKEDYLSAIEKTVTLAVKMLNSTGVFKKA